MMSATAHNIRARTRVPIRKKPIAIAIAIRMRQDEELDQLAGCIVPALDPDFFFPISNAKRFFFVIPPRYKRMGRRFFPGLSTRLLFIEGYAHRTTGYDCSPHVRSLGLLQECVCGPAPTKKKIQGPLSHADVEVRPMITTSIDHPCACKAGVGTNAFSRVSVVPAHFFVDSKGYPIPNHGHRE